MASNLERHEEDGAVSPDLERVDSSTALGPAIDHVRRDFGGRLNGKRTIPGRPLLGTSPGLCVRSRLEE